MRLYKRDLSAGTRSGTRLLILFAAACCICRWAAPSFVSAPHSGYGQRSGLSAGTRVGAQADTVVESPTGAVKAESPEMTTALERLATAKTITEKDFWCLVKENQIQEAVLVSWSGKQLLAHLKDGTFVGVKEKTDVEDLRNELLLKSVPFSYPASDSLSEEEALEAANISSEGPVAGGVLTAMMVGLLDTALADTVLEIGGPVALGSTGIGVQSFLENEQPAKVIAEDISIVEQDITDWSQQTLQWLQASWQGLFANHAPGLGGIIEDSFMAILVVTSVFSLVQMATLKRKAKSLAGDAHTATGAMQIAIVLYAIVQERCLREAPGPLWAIFTFAIFMVNNLTMWPLLKFFRGPEVQRVLFKLAYSFIISFQGIHAIAWSSQYPWLYWVVMPFWFWSLKKLAESSDNILALIPDQTGGLLGGLQDSAKRRVKGIQNDAPTYVYSILNFAGAVFDNLYMAVYTWRGPAGFWSWSAANIPAVNDHLRTALVKPAFGSLTISVLVFLGTLVYRKKISKDVAIAANVVLASVGPWLILYYHKLIDWDEPWQPEIAGDWALTPYFIEHWADLMSFFGMAS